MCSASLANQKAAGCFRDHSQIKKADCNIGVVSWKHAPPKRKRLLFQIESLGMAA